MSSLPPLPIHDASMEAALVDEAGTVVVSRSSGGAVVPEEGIVEETPFCSATVDPSTKPLVKRRRLRRTGDVSSAAVAQTLVVAAFSTDDHVEK